MAIFVTGDTHGPQSIGCFSVDGFMSRLNTASFPEQKSLSKDDFVVICGDFGGVWYSDRLFVRESPNEKNALDWLESKPFTTLFVPGNHENYDRLTGCRDEALIASWFFAKMAPEEKDKLRRGYPRIAWHGGFVRQIRPSVLMLESGWIFDIDGQACFAFGGARSHDIRDGILDPAQYPDESAFKKDYKIKKSGYIRVKGVSWWEQEMPTQEEMDRGRRSLSAHLDAGGRIDFIFTHEAPALDAALMGFHETNALTLYLDEIRKTVPYGQWFYGHLHDNRKTAENRHLLYEQIIRIH